MTEVKKKSAQRGTIRGTIEYTELKNFILRKISLKCL